MKAPSKLIICFASAGLLAATAFAQSSGNEGNYNQPNTGTEPNSSENLATQPNAGMQGANQGQDFYHAKSFLGTKVKDQQGQSLGDIRDIVFSPSTGETFAAFDAGNSRYFLVPWQALTITPASHGKEQVSLNATKQDLESGPTIPRNQWQQLSNTSFTQGIYSHYNLQPPSTSMGGVGGKSMGGALKGGASGGSSSWGSGSSTQQPK